LSNVKEKLEIVNELGGFVVSETNDMYIYFDRLYRKGLITDEEIRGLQREIFTEGEGREYYKA